MRTKRQRPGDVLTIPDPIKMPNLPKQPALPPLPTAARRPGTANLPSALSNLPPVETIDDDSPYSPTEDSPQPGYALLKRPLFPIETFIFYWYRWWRDCHARSMS